MSFFLARRRVVSGLKGVKVVQMVIPSRWNSCADAFNAMGLVWKWEQENGNGSPVYMCTPYSTNNNIRESILHKRGQLC